MAILTIYLIEKKQVGRSQRRKESNRQAECAQHQQVDRQQGRQTAAGDVHKHGEKSNALVLSL